jgi:hypothetical protein
MKRIVDNAIPSATSTILGEKGTLDTTAQQHLASWLALSAIVADSQMKHRDKIAHEDLQFIRKTGVPPPHWHRAEARVAAKTLKPVRDVKPSADRAEARAKPGVVAADPVAKDSPDDEASTLIGVLTWFERIRAPIELKASISGMSQSDLIILDAQITRAQGWIGQIAMITAAVTRAKEVAS